MWGDLSLVVSMRTPSWGLPCKWARDCSHHNIPERHTWHPLSLVRFATMGALFIALRKCSDMHSSSHAIRDPPYTQCGQRAIFSMRQMHSLSNFFAVRTFAVDNPGLMLLRADCPVRKSMDGDCENGMHHRSLATNGVCACASANVCAHVRTHACGVGCRHCLDSDKSDCS
eukprot:Opistho-2@42827